MILQVTAVSPKLARASSSCPPQQHHKKLAVQCLNEALCPAVYMLDSVLADSLCFEIRFFAKRQNDIDTFYGEKKKNPNEYRYQILKDAQELYSNNLQR